MLPVSKTSRNSALQTEDKVKSIKNEIKLPIPQHCSTGQHKYIGSVSMESVLLSIQTWLGLRMTLQVGTLGTNEQPLSLLYREVLRSPILTYQCSSLHIPLSSYPQTPALVSDLPQPNLPTLIPHRQIATIPTNRHTRDPSQWRPFRRPIPVNRATRHVN